MPKNKTTKTDLATQDKAELATTSVIDFSEDAGAGSEEMSKNDLAIPRLRILQALSPQVKKKNEAYVEGAEEGDILDTVSLALMGGGDGVLVVPISYRHAYIEWKLRESGGGFVADHENDVTKFKACTVDTKGRHLTANETQIVPTAEYFIFVVDEETGAATPYVLSMSGSQKKHSRRWNTLINTLRVANPNGQGTFNPAMFYKSYRLTTQPESNDQGDWFGWSIAVDKDALELSNGEEIYLGAREFAKQIREGEVKASIPSTDAPQATEESEEHPM